MKNFYQGKSILITGHTGFKGSVLAMVLSALGARVHGYSLAPEDIRGNFYNLVSLDKKISSSTFGDITDYSSFQKAVVVADPEVIFHLAAQPFVLRSYNDPLETYKTNVIGTANLFEIIRTNPKLKTRAVVNITTDKCYENQEWIYPYRETDRLGGHDPYSASKAAAEIVTTSYRKSFFADYRVGIATARAGNVIGGGDFGENRIVPDIIEAIEKNRNIVLRNPESIRPWQQVLDVINGYLLLGKALHQDPKNFSESFNFGPDSNNSVPVKDLVVKLLANLEKNSHPIKIEKSDKHESSLLTLDSSKARKKLDWKPRFAIDEAIKVTAQWYKVFLDQRDALNEFSEKQIKVFFNL